MAKCHVSALPRHITGPTGAGYIASSSATTAHDHLLLAELR